MLYFPQVDVRRDARTLLTNGPSVCVLENGLKLNDVRDVSHLPLPNAVHPLHEHMSQQKLTNDSQ